MGVLNGNQTEVCGQCHEDLTASSDAKVRHEPFADGRCSACHNPHMAQMETLLRASGTDLCLSCHEGLRERMKTEQVHHPVREDCQNCHLPHQGQHEALLSSEQSALCGDCHELDSVTFADNHLKINPELMACGKCHAPHTSDDPKLFRKNAHAPFVSRSCNKCHLD